jgi:hypothetical protein
LTKKLKKSWNETSYGKQMDRRKIKERKVTQIKKKDIKHDYKTKCADNERSMA